MLIILRMTQNVNVGKCDLRHITLLGTQRRYMRDSEPLVVIVLRGGGDICYY